MTLKLGSLTLTSAMLGSTILTKAYLNGNIVFSIAPPAVVSDQTAYVGEMTLADVAAFQIVDDSGEPLTGASITGGTATGVSMSSTGEISPDVAGGFAGQTGNTLAISCDQGTATITLDVEANAGEFTTGEELASLIGAFAANGTAIDYKAYAVEGKTITRDDAGTRTIIGSRVFDGSVTATNEGVTRAIDLNRSATATMSGGSFTITCRTHLGATWGQHRLELLGCGPFAVEGIDFHRLAASGEGATTNQILIATTDTHPYRGEHIVRNNLFGGTAAGGTGEEWPFCVAVGASVKSVVEDNEFDGYMHGTSISSVDQSFVRRNTAINQGVDALRLGFGVAVEDVTGGRFYPQVHDNVFYKVSPLEYFAPQHSDGGQYGSYDTTADCTILFAYNYLYLDVYPTTAIIDAVEYTRYTQGMYFDDHAEGSVLDGEVAYNMVVSVGHGSTLWRSSFAGTMLHHNNTIIKGINALAAGGIESNGGNYSSAEVVSSYGSPRVWANLAKSFNNSGATGSNDWFKDGNMVADNASQGSDGYDALFVGPFTWVPLSNTWTFPVDETSAATVKTSLDSVFTRLAGSPSLEMGHLGHVPMAPFIAYDFTVTGGAGQIEIDITNLPDTGGETRTDLEYSTDAGVTWASLGGTTATTYIVTSHSDSSTFTTEGVDVVLRQVSATEQSYTGEGQTAAVTEVTGPVLLTSFADSTASATQYETTSFTASDKPILVCVASRNGTSAQNLHSVTIGTPNRDFGTGTSFGTHLTYVRDGTTQNMIFGLISPGSGDMTVQIESPLGNYSIGVDVIEVAGATGFGDTDAKASRTASFTSPLSVTTTAANSVVIYSINQLAPASATLAITDATEINSGDTGDIHQYQDQRWVTGYEDAPTVGSYDANYTANADVYTVGTAIEVTM